MIYIKTIALFFFFITLSSAQQADNLYRIELGQTRFAVSQPFTISAILPNTDTRPVVNFPDIPGLTKAGTTTGVRSVETDGRETLVLVISQSYRAAAPGQFAVPAFELVLNGQTLRADAVTLTVEAAPGNTTETPDPVLLLLPKNPGAGDAFLSLATDRTTAFAGQGVLVRLSLFVAESYPAELRFDRLDAQIEALTETLRLPGTLQENANIREVQPGPVRINNRRFTEYRLYQSTLFSLTEQPIRLPALTLTMLRLSLPNAGGSDSKSNRILFSSKPLVVIIQPLPDHPLRGQVAVGQFRLVESLTQNRITAGQSVSYEFGIDGIGNVAGLVGPTVTPLPDMTVYPPTVQRRIGRAGGLMSGQKAFRYFVLPRQTGSFALADVFRWVYFDPIRARYDTLRPRLRLTVTGNATPLTLAPEMPIADSSRNSPASVGGPASIYAGLENMDSSQQPLNTATLIRALANVLLILLLLSLLFVFIRK